MSVVVVKSAAQIEKMRRSGKLLYEVLQELRALIKPGVTTAYLDDYALEAIRKRGAEPSFLGYNGFPKTICASADDKVVHGIPSQGEVLKEGSILSVDCGLVYDGWQADSAFTVGVGEISPELQELIKVTERAFFAGAKAAIQGNRVVDIGRAVSAAAEGYGVIRALTGHGIGRAMHEAPSIPNYDDGHRSIRLKAGMTLAIEPMIALDGHEVTFDNDGWTVRTQTRCAAAHYEHTIAVTQGLPELLTLPGFVWGQEDGLEA